MKIQHAISLREQYSLILLLCCCLISCGNWQSSSQDILLDMPYVHVSGGYCGQAVILMVAGYYDPDALLQYDAVMAWKTTQLFLSDMPILAQELFGLRLQWGTYPAMAIRWQLLQRKPFIAVVPGWRGMWHTVLIIGLQAQDWIVHDPTRQAYMHLPIELECRGFILL